MRVGAIVLARLDSRRLQRKALRDLAGKPLVRWAIDACLAARGVDAVVLATSDRMEDDELAAYARTIDLPTFRGSFADVAKRFLDAMEAFGFDAALRLNGDSPLSRVPMLESAIAVFREGGCDVVSNVPGRTFPFGLSCEIVSLSAMRTADKTMRHDHPAREHVTKIFYDQPDLVRLRLLRAAEPGASGIQLAVDDPNDLAKLSWMIGRLNGEVSSAPMAELVSLAREYEATRRVAR